MQDPQPIPEGWQIPFDRRGWLLAAEVHAATPEVDGDTWIAVREGEILCPLWLSDVPVPALGVTVKVYLPPDWSRRLLGPDPSARDMRSARRLLGERVREAFVEWVRGERGDA